jgi:Sugar transferases involved in lipopolysaccharide synthesis
LINVLKGDMSLIGPRPAMPDQMTLYGRSVRDYCAVRPGITGLWQVTARGNSDFRRRIALDCYYAKNCRPALDLGILLRTIVVVLRGTGAH